MVQNALRHANSNPYAIAYLLGNTENKEIKGRVEFFNWASGSIIKLEITGLPSSNKNNFFGFHIHEYDICEKEDFLTAGEHFNLENDTHPNHMGDLPMIYSNNGYAFMLYYTDRFTPKDVIGKSVIIHKMIDDLKTNPSGNSGERIACGKIIKRKWMFM